MSPDPLIKPSEVQNKKHVLAVGGLDEPDLSTLVEGHEDDDEFDFESGIIPANRC